MSAFGGKADITADPIKCPLLTQRRHKLAHRIFQAVSAVE
jgi:hypothetical protein